MNGKQPWEEVVAAEGVYLETRRQMFEAGAEEQLSLALQSPTGRGSALRVLRDSPLEVLMGVLPGLFDAASSTHPQVGLAREVLGRVDSGWLSTALVPLVESRLQNKASDWSDYRRLAECLSEIGQSRLLAVVVERADQSDDDDIREVAEDFRRD